MFEQVELNKLYTVTLPDAINEVGIRLLSQQFYDYIRPALYYDNTLEQTKNKIISFNDYEPYEIMPPDWVWQYTANGKNKYIGNMARRMSKLAQDEYNIKLTAEQLAVLGQLARDNSTSEETVYIDFTNTFNWEAGDFGDSGSCYWGCHTSARTILVNYSALGMRLWRNAEVYGEIYNRDKYGYKQYPGIGRVWVAPPTSHNFGDYALVFNGYGGINKDNGDHTNFSTLWFARVLAAFLGTDYKKIKLNNYDTWDGDLWINSGNAYAVGNWLNVAEIKILDLQWGDCASAENDNYTCENCDWSTDDEDLMYYPEDGGGPLCEECYYEKYTHCYSCETELCTRNAYNAFDNDYCYDCYSERFLECIRCGRVEYSDEVTCVNDDDYYCKECLTRSGALECSDCRGYYTYNMKNVVYHSSIREYRLVYYCENCLDKDWLECNNVNCSNYFDLDFADNDDEELCEYCR